jgi:hypothetical protein
MQKLWYSTNDASGHEKSPSKHEISANNKTQNQGKYQSAGAHTSCSINQGHALPKNPFLFQML